MSGPEAYAFEPRRKRRLDTDAAVEERVEGDSDTGSDENVAVAPSTRSAIVTSDCTRDLKLLDPSSDKKCVLQLDTVHDSITDVSIKLAWRKAQRDYWHKRADMLRFSLMTPENYRFHGYQNYVEFVNGYLGTDCRMAIPLCVVKHLRRRYPDQNQQYRGFIPSRSGDVEEVTCALAEL